jgi:hypothetical protein
MIPRPYRWDKLRKSKGSGGIMQIIFWEPEFEGWAKKSPPLTGGGLYLLVRNLLSSVIVERSDLDIIQCHTTLANELSLFSQMTLLFKTALDAKYPFLLCFRSFKNSYYGPYC